MFKTPKAIFFWLVLLSVVLVFLDLPENYRLKFTAFGKSIDRVINPPTFRFSLFGLRIEKQFVTKLGLDLAGGSHVVLEADMKDVQVADRVSALESAKEVIERRVNFLVFQNLLCRRLSAKMRIVLLLNYRGSRMCRRR